MNRTLAAIAVMALSSPAHAQVTGQAFSDWQGFYVGAQLNYFSDSEFSASSTSLIGGDVEGEIFGTFIGYRHQFGAFVVGAEVDFVGGEVDSTITALGTGTTDTSDLGIIRAGGEVGYAFGRFLPYAHAGIARVVFRDTMNGGDNSSTGSFVGLGLDYQTGEHGSIGVELNRQSFDDLDPDLSLDATTVGVSFALRY